MEKQLNQSPAYKSSWEEKNESIIDMLRISDHSVPDYSEQEAEALEERLLHKETFSLALQILIAWLNRGECKERNSAHFFHLIQLGSDSFKKLQTDREKRLDEAIKALEELFHVIEKQDIWINFTKGQKEDIQDMKANILHLQDNILIDESVNYQENQKMALQTKVGSLTYELNAAKKLKESLENESIDKENEILKLRSELEKRTKDKNEILIIISLLSAFLFKHPEGVNLDTILSNLNDSPLIPKICAEQIEGIMRSHPIIFKEALDEECLPMEATREKKWTCIRMDPET